MPWNETRPRHLDLKKKTQVSCRISAMTSSLPMQAMQEQAEQIEPARKLIN